MKRLARAFAGLLLAQDARQVFGIERLAPIEAARLLVREAEELHVGLVDEGAPAVEPRHPDRHWRAVGDEPEALLTLAQLLFGVLPLRDVDMCADQPNWPPLFVALDLGLD